MNLIRSLKPSLAAAAFVLAFGTANSLASDAVVESFDRMLAHQPGEGRPVNAFESEVDVLVTAVVVPLRGDLSSPAPVAAADPVMESFQRMLSHAPQAVASAVPAGFEPDPLLAAMVEPLRRGSGGGAAMNYARAGTRPSRQ